MRVHGENWFAETRELSPTARLTYYWLARTCSENEDLGAKFPTDVAFEAVEIATGRDSDENADAIWELLDVGLLTGRTSPGYWAFPSHQINADWLTCVRPYWHGSMPLVDIHPLGRCGAKVRRQPIGKKLRQAVIERDGMVCGICNETIDGDLHIDHIHPVARGGKTVLENLQPAHPFCNQSKGARVFGGLG